MIVNDNLELERLIEQDVKVVNRNMTFGPVFKSMIPSIIVGTAAAAGCQEIASEYTSNPEAITMAGMVGQYIGGFCAYLPIYYHYNRDRLKDEDGRIKCKQFAQDIGSILVSDQIGNKIWLALYGLSNEMSLRNGLDSSTAGIVSGATSGLVYSAFTAYMAPKINSIINAIDKYLGISEYREQVRAERKAIWEQEKRIREMETRKDDVRKNVLKLESYPGGLDEYNKLTGTEHTIIDTGRLVKSVIYKTTARLQMNDRIEYDLLEKIMSEECNGFIHSTSHSDLEDVPIGYYSAGTPAYRIKQYQEFSGVPVKKLVKKEK